MFELLGLFELFVFLFCLHGLRKSTQKDSLLYIPLLLFFSFLSMLNLLIDSYIVV